MNNLIRHSHQLLFRTPLVIPRANSGFLFRFHEDTKCDLVLQTCVNEISQIVLMLPHLGKLFSLIILFSDKTGFQFKSKYLTSQMILLKTKLVIL